MKYVFLVFFLFAYLLQADTNTTENIQQEPSEDKILKEKALNERLSNVNKKLKENIWLTRYANYTTYQELHADLDKVNEKIKKLSPTLKRKRANYKRIDILKREKTTLKKQLELLKEYNDNAFEKVIEPQALPETTKIDNPLAIFNAFSYTKQLHELKNDYAKKIASLDSVIKDLEEKKSILHLLDTNNTDDFENITNEINDFKSTLDVAKTTYAVYTKNIEEKDIKTTNDIKAEVKSSINILIFIIISFIIALILKLAAKKYIADNERYYMTNKIINFTNFFIIVLILLFSFIDNVSYLVTVLGFASAGIAIAMKDWFMSILGWFVIVLGGSIHVGDRIKVKKDGVVYVGDVLDISLLRITIHEDITLTSYMENRRTGRIIFVPNNYVFTSLIANYSHGSLKTVWDGIDVNITFDSNHKKAAQLTKEIVKKYSKGYTDITRKQLNKLRDQYNLRNTNVEPRVYTFIEAYGVRVSSWYLTNAFATLTLRSTISAEILDAFNAHDDITLAYPTYAVSSPTPTSVPLVPQENSNDSSQYETKSLF